MPSADVTVKITVLWESEVREASRLLRALNEIPDDGEHKEQRTAAIYAAFRACQVALWGVKDDQCVLMLGNDEIRKHLPKTKRAKR